MTGISTNLATARRVQATQGLSLWCRTKAFLSIFPMVLSGHCVAADLQPCATSIGELRVLTNDPAFPLRWEETSMSDGKPLVVSILERNGSLHLEFIKTSEGLWLESAGVICKNGHELEARFSASQIRMGPAANWLLRAAAGNGGEFRLNRLGTEQLRIATSGWSGTFVPSRK